MKTLRKPSRGFIFLLITDVHTIHMKALKIITYPVLATVAAKRCNGRGRAVNYTATVVHGAAVGIYHHNSFQW